MCDAESRREGGCFWQNLQWHMPGQPLRIVPNKFEQIYVRQFGLAVIPKMMNRK